jgi:hypothetical protein
MGKHNDVPQRQDGKDLRGTAVHGAFLSIKRTCARRERHDTSIMVDFDSKLRTTFRASDVRTNEATLKVNVGPAGVPIKG